MFSFYTMLLLNSKCLSSSVANCAENKKQKQKQTNKQINKTIGLPILASNQEDLYIMEYAQTSYCNSIKEIPDNE